MDGEDPILKRFLDDVAKFSGHYDEFVVIVKSGERRLMWKSSDLTWGIGAARRYLVTNEEMDRLDTGMDELKDS